MPRLVSERIKKLREEIAEINEANPTHMHSRDGGEPPTKHGGSNDAQTYRNGSSHATTLPDLQAREGERAIKHGLYTRNQPHVQAPAARQAATTRCHQHRSSHESEGKAKVSLFAVHTRKTVVQSRPGCI
jgi:hypothetical protein